MDSGENFVHALAAAFSVIIVSEVGDKTFFIAAILAMRHSRLEVLLGAMAANFIMIIISGDKTATSMSFSFIMVNW